jgi:hypothetical protein
MRQHERPMKIIIALSLCFLFVLMSGCSVHTDIEPLEAGRLNANLSVGGPFVKSGTTHLPVPYCTVGAVYGLGYNFNASVNLHVLPLLYELSAFDIGASYYFTENRGPVPVIGIHPSLLTFISLKSAVDEQARSYPSVTMTAAWHIGKAVLFTGFDYTMPLNRPDYDTDAPYAIFSPFIGYGINLGRGIRLTSELKWQAANVPSDQLAVEYSRINGHGAVGILFALEKSF